MEKGYVVKDGAVINTDDNEWQRFQAERSKALQMHELKQHLDQLTKLVEAVVQEVAEFKKEVREKYG